MVVAAIDQPCPDAAARRRANAMSRVRQTSVVAPMMFNRVHLLILAWMGDSSSNLSLERGG
jgi:hypothetical protein